MTERYSLLEHTADIGLEARADSLPGLFVAAGRGLREILSTAEGTPPDQTISVSLKANDTGELMVNWLNEILFLLESRHLFPIDFLIDSVDAGHLEARVHGFAFDPDETALDREVKAATYHQLRVERGDDGSWYARIYLDL